MRLLNVLVFLIIFSGIHAQSVISVSGGEIQNQEGSVEYYIGQCFFTEDIGSELIFFEDEVLDGATEYVDIKEDPKDLNISITPNPFDEFLEVQLPQHFFANNSMVKCQITDYTGKVVIQSDISNQEMVFELGELKPAVYFISFWVYENDLIIREITATKIIKL